MKTESDAPFYIRGATARRIWANAYNDAARIFNPPGGMGGSGPRYRPGPIAETVVNGLCSNGRRRRLPGAKKLPYPGGLVDLGGPLLAVYVADKDGRIHTVQGWATGLPPYRCTKSPWTYTKGPRAAWSLTLTPRAFPSGGSVIAFRNKRWSKPAIHAGAIPELLETYREWHGGKDPRGLSHLRISTPPLLGPAQVCVATKYRSDKFGKNGEFMNYIHVHESDGVMFRMGKDALMIQGGRLRLTPGGLVG